MAVAFVERIGNHFEKVTDPRVNRGTNYPLIEMVFVALCGAICDCNAWTDVADFGEAKLAWFRKFLPFEKLEQVGLVNRIFNWRRWHELSNPRLAQTRQDKSQVL